MISCGLLTLSERASRSSTRDPLRALAALRHRSRDRKTVIIRHACLINRTKSSLQQHGLFAGDVRNSKRYEQSEGGPVKWLKNNNL